MNILHNALHSEISADFSETSDAVRSVLFQAKYYSFDSINTCFISATLFHQWLLSITICPFSLADPVFSAFTHLAVKVTISCLS